MKRENFYTLDTSDRMRVWYLEINDEDKSQYKVVSGLEDGKKAESKWKTAKPKNIGKKNETTSEEQAISECVALEVKQVKKGYNLDRNDAHVISFFQPMLANKLKEKLHKLPEMVFYQPKLDGIRCVANSKGLFTRTGEQILSCPHIEKSLVEFFEKHPNAILDGELYNHKFHNNFNEIQSMITTRLEKKLNEDFLAKTKKFVEYHVYDIPQLDEDENKPFRHRNENIKLLENLFSVLPVCTYYCSLAEHEEKLRNFLSLNYEGSMIRNPDGFYESKRSDNLLKDKNFVDEEFKIARLVEGEGNWKGAVKSVEFYMPDGRITSSGIDGTFDLNKQRLEEKEEYENDGYATVRYQNLTPDGLPRIPVTKALYKGKRNK